MATVTKSIGATARDYSTITLWEADLDDTGIYSASDDAVGECYNDSPFDETVIVNGGGTVGLNLATLSVASGERHDGTAGTGVRMFATDNIYLQFMDGPTTGYEIEWFEFDANGYFSDSANYGVIGGNDSGAPVLDIRNCLVHGVAATGWGEHANGIVSGWSADHTATNCVVYDLASTNASNSRGKGIGSRHAGGGIHKHYNCTVHDVTTGSSDGVGFNQKGSSSCTSQNCISTGCDIDFDITNGTLSYDASSDATATGTGSITSITTADQYVSTVGGSEDLHLKAGSDCIDAGTDLGTTPTGVNIDINGRDRDAEADTWDIGAHEFIAAAAAATTSVGWTRSLTPSPVRPSYKSGFARSAAESSSPGLWDGLQGIWSPFLGSSGTVLRELSGRHDDGTFTGLTGSDWTASKYGPTFLLNGSGDAVVTTSPGVLGTTASTVVVWFSTISTDTADNCLVGYGTNDTGTQYVLTVENGVIWNRFGANTVSGGSGFNDGAWHYVACVKPRNGKTSDCRLYVDGTELSTTPTGSTTLNMGSTEPVSLGSPAVVSGYRFNGYLGTAAIYDCELSLREINQYRDPLSPFRLRRFTPTYSPVAEEEATTTSVGWTRSLTPSPVRPSYKSGFARSASTSAYPGLHDGMVVAYVPALGITGDTWHNVLSTTFPASPTQTRNEGVNKFGIHSGETGSGSNTISDCRTTLQGEATVMFVGQIGDRPHGSQRIFSIDSGAGFGDLAFIRNTAYNNGLLGVNWGWAGFVVTYAVSDNATGVWVARRTGTAGSWTAEIWEDGLLAAQTTGETSNPTGGNTPVCTIATRDACEQLNALMAWNRALSDNEIRHLSKDIVAPFRQRRFTPTISGAAEAAGWQPYWGLHATRFAGILT